MTKSQRTLSNALAMSNFKNNPSVLFRYRLLIMFWEYKKLSWMLRFLMNALCARDTILFSSGASLLDRSLENNFATE